MQDEQLVYGVHPVEELLRARSRPVEKVFFDRDRANGPLYPILKECNRAKIPYQLVGQAKLRDLVGNAVHQGVVAVCGLISYTRIHELLSIAERRREAPLLLVADSVEDPHNLGAVIRTALAAGVHGILLPRQGGAALTPAVAKASAGALEKMTIAKPDDIAAELANLKAKGFAVAGLESGASKSYRAGHYSGPLVVVIGGEHKGIRPHIRRHCTDLYSIPIRSDVNSLNLSVAAGIFLFEVVDQRCRMSDPSAI